jgi:hypothetical protein
LVLRYAAIFEHRKAHAMKPANKKNTEFNSGSPEINSIIISLINDTKLFFTLIVHSNENITLINNIGILYP